MIKIKKSAIALLAPIGLLLAGTSSPVYAIHASGSHAGGHTTAHPSSHPASHPAVHPSTSHVNTTAKAPASSAHTTTSSTHVTARPSASISRGTLNSRSTISNKSTASKSAIARSAISTLPKTKVVNRSVKTAQSSTTYHNLHTNMQRSDFVFWHAYTAYNYTRPYYDYYPWMPYWMFHSAHNHDADAVKQTVQKKHMKWIRVGNKTIAVPEKLYKIIKVGDEIELTDNTHIVINDKTYNR